MSWATTRSAAPTPPSHTGTMPRAICRAASSSRPACGCQQATDGRQHRGLSACAVGLRSASRLALAGGTRPGEDQWRIDGRRRRPERCSASIGSTNGEGSGEPTCWHGLPPPRRAAACGAQSDEPCPEPEAVFARGQAAGKGGVRRGAPSEHHALRRAQYGHLEPAARGDGEAAARRRRPSVGRRPRLHAARASPARSADFGFWALGPPMAPRGASRPTTSGGRVGRSACRRACEVVGGVGGRVGGRTRTFDKRGRVRCIIIR